MTLSQRRKLKRFYFDFSKAFDSVNHDLILSKLKNMYGIDGRLLKFIQKYPHGREQSVVLENCVSTSKPGHQECPKDLF